MVGAAIIAQAREEGIGISSFVALGNRADVSGNDLLQYWEDDEHTDVVGLYIESFGNARHFSRLARRLTPGQAGGGGEGRVAAGRPAARRDRLRRRAAPPDGRDPRAVAAGAARHDALPGRPAAARPGRRVAVVGNAGGSLAIGADAAVAAGLELAVLGDDARAAPLDARRAPDRRRQPDRPRPASGRRRRSRWPCRLLVGRSGRGRACSSCSPRRSAARRPRCAPRSTRRGPSARTCRWPPASTAARPRTGPSRGARVRADLRRSRRGRPGPRSGGRATPRGCSEEEGDPARARAREAATAASDDDHRPRWPPGVDELALAEVAGVLRVRSGVDVVGDQHGGDRVDEAVAARPRPTGYPVALKAACRDAMAKTVAAGLALDLADEAALAQRPGSAWRSASATRCCRRSCSRWSSRAWTWPSRCTTTPRSGRSISLRPGGANAALDQDAELQVLPIGDREARAAGRPARASRPTSSDAAAAHLEELLLRLGALVEEVPEIVGLCGQPGHRARRRGDRRSRPASRCARSSGSRSRRSAGSAATPSGSWAGRGRARRGCCAGSGRCRP